MYSVSHVFSRKAKLSKLILCGWMISFFVSGPGYAMQPPPPPLKSVQFEKLIAEADIIVVGQIGQVKKTAEIDKSGEKITIEVILRIEKLLKGKLLNRGKFLKGKVLNKNVHIKEYYPGSNLVTPGAISKGEKEEGRRIFPTTAGPSCYHGRYKEGARIIVLLAAIEATNEYKPLGSGTYNRHLCEFLIENDGIKALYFKFADDIEKHAQSEDKFITLIKRLLEKN